MAYTLSDHYRPLRIALRVNGSTVGVALGLALLTLSRHALAAWGLYQGGSLWPMRLAGAALLALGLLFLLIASQPEIGLSMLVPIITANTLIALVLLVGYFQQEFAGLTIAGRILLVIIFALCLVGVLAPLPYLRAEYRR
ncbi:MAG: hypothetical protein DCC55_25805 [Chloroflexi bacterium]|nr:MAG: hypothetical protein DCC55_25805 [Chloroflexota bacterium]